jgi:hypothetical protein
MSCEVQVPSDVASLCVVVDEEEEEEGIFEAANINLPLFCWKEAATRSARPGKGRCNGCSDHICCRKKKRRDWMSTRVISSIELHLHESSTTSLVRSPPSLQSETSHNAVDIVQQIYKQTDGLNHRSMRGNEHPRPQWLNPLPSTSQAPKHA